MADQVWVKERWDNGAWDEAHFDGQLGFNAAVTAITITPQDVTFTITATSDNFVLTAEMVTVWIAPQEVNLRITYAPTPQPGAINLGIPKYFVDRW